MAQDYSNIYQAQKAFFKTGTTKPAAFRIAMLEQLEQRIREHEQELTDALYKDLRKHPQEVYMTELGGLYEEIKEQKKNLRAWMKPKSVPTPLFLFPASSKIYPEPLGNVLIITPWNYPVLLTFAAVAGAMAAGNTILIKPSELTVHTSAVMEKMINDHFPEGYMHVLNGDGAEVVPALLLNFHFDHVMFTGSTSVGSKVMEMAAQKLSPVTLELGGKSPCIVAADANIAMAAKRIVWGKFINCGQTCIAPDYLLVEASVKDALVAALKKEIIACYGEDPRNSESYPRIIHARRFQTLASYLTQGTVIHGGQTDVSDLYIAPTLMEDVPDEASLMKDEIFGPILPMFTYQDKEEVLDRIEKNPYPLALYVFSGSVRTQKFFIDKIRFGGGAMNETILHLGNSELPFGGIGYSGHGAYHGRHSFDTFSHFKSVLKRGNLFEPAFRHAPFSAFKTKLWKYLLGKK